MRKVIAVAAAGAVALVGLAVAAPPAHAADVIEVCLTVTPKSVSVTVNGEVIGSPVVEQPRTCVGV